MLSRQDILQADDLPTVEVDVPEWGGNLLVRMLTALELEDFTAVDDNRNVRARFAVLAVVNENGKRLFTDDDAEALGGKSMPALETVWKAGAKLNGIGQDEDAVKNFEKTPEPSSS